VKLGAMTVDLGQGSLNSELKMMLEESEKKISEIIKGFVVVVVYFGRSPQGF